MVHTSIDSVLKNLDWLEESCCLASPLKDQILNLKGECSGDFEQIATDIKAVSEEAALFRFRVNEVEEEQIEEMNLDISRLLRKMKLIKAEIFLLRLIESEETSMFLGKDDLRALHEGLLFFRTLLLNNRDIEADIEDGKLLSIYLEYVVNESSSLIPSCGLSEMTLDMAIEKNLSIFRLLVKIKLIKAEVMLMEIMKLPDVVSTVHMRDEVEILREGVRFLTAFLMNPPKEEVELLVAKSEAVANEVASTIFPFHYQVMNEHMTLEINHSLSNLVDKIELLKVDIKDTYLEVPNPECFSLSKIERNELILSLLKCANEVLNRETKSLPFMKSRIEIILGEFEFLESFIDGVEQSYRHIQELKDVWDCFKDVERQVNYIIDLLVGRDDPVWYFMLWISFAMENIKLIEAKVTEISDLGVHAIASYRPLETCVPLIGMEDKRNFIVDQIIRGTEQMHIIADISGSGKTTLARTVYNDQLVVEFFPFRAWCYVSREYKRRQSLLSILGDLNAVSDSTYEMGDDELAAELHNFLKQKTYLIVLDDIWDLETLYELRRSFPDDNSGSQILLTTRILSLAKTVDSSAYIHRLRVLRLDDSWALLKRGIFREQFPDPSLVEAGKMIARHCMGVPLAILLMSGILANTERNLSRWVSLEQTLSSYDPRNGWNFVVELAYDCLPEHLKPCFLCFGELPQDEVIPALKLQQIWSARGLLQETDSRTLEDVADDYLSDFVSRNLIELSKRRYNGRVRAFHVHDSVRELSLNKMYT